MQDVIAVIPARSGSKTIPHKNIRAIAGKPLLAYSIEQALMSKSVSRVIVSTDSEDYASIARDYGAETPFLRPKAISGDSSLDINLFIHLLEWLETNEGRIPKALVHLRPTHPVRYAKDIDIMVERLLAHPKATAIRSVSPAKQTPYKMWRFEANGILKPALTCEVPEAYNAPRQDLPKIYMQNACIDVVKSITILRQHSMTGDNVLGYVMDYDFDIDTEDEFLLVEQYIQLQKAAKEGKKLTICCDIDGVLACKTMGNNYAEAFPIQENVDLVNRLTEAGHTVLLFTARGYVTGIDWEQTTRNQMRNWGVRYSELHFGKPAADIYIDDRYFSIETLKQIF